MFLLKYSFFASTTDLSPNFLTLCSDTPVFLSLLASHSFLLLLFTNIFLLWNIQKIKIFVWGYWVNRKLLHAKDKRFRGYNCLKPHSSTIEKKMITILAPFQHILRISGHSDKVGGGFAHILSLINLIEIFIYHLCAISFQICISRYELSLLSQVYS